jgi:hypothetical protein
MKSMTPHGITGLERVNEQLSRIIITGITEQKTCILRTDEKYDATCITGLERVKNERGKQFS